MLAESLSILYDLEVCENQLPVTTIRYGCTIVDDFSIVFDRSKPAVLRIICLASLCARKGLCHRPFQ